MKPNAEPMVTGTIWATPYDPATLQCTGSSQPSGFDSLPEVIAAMGEPRRQSAAYALYDGVIFSRIEWARIDASDTTA